MMSLNPLTLPLDQRVLIEASAGTGKTFTIAALYVRLILGHQVPRPLLPHEILVVTFTDAATSELKSRIRARLSQAARYFAEETDDADVFLQHLRTEFTNEQWPRCAERLQLAAQSMDEACVSTIHGWCNRMLTEHAFASGAAFGRRLVTDEASLWLEVCQDYWRSFVYGMALSHYPHFIKRFASPEALCQDVMRLQDVPLAEDLLSQAPSSLIQAELQQRALALAAIKAPWAQWIDELAALIDDGRRLGLTNNNKLRSDIVAKWWEKLRLWQQSEDATMPDIGAGVSRLTPDGMAEAWKGEVPQHPAFTAMLELPAHLAALPDAAPALRQHAACWVLTTIKQRKQQQRLLGFNDLLAGLDEALTQSAELAGIIRAQFPLALIDEFQDTDPLQYRIFRHIYGTDGALILIGDPKQAIYGFRGADIYTYLQAKLESPAQFSLGTNYRSTRDVVKSVNHLFLNAEQRAAGRGAFLLRDAQDLVPFLPVDAHGRSEQLRLGDAVLPAMRFQHYDSEKELSKSSWLTIAAEQSATSIATLLAEAAQQGCGFWRDNQWQRPLQSRDIAVLVNNQREADAIRASLFARGIRSVYLSDKGTVFESPMASQLALWLEAVLEPRQAKIRNALATPALGQALAYLDALTDQQWDRLQQQFADYARIWQRQGVQPMLTQLMFDFAVVANVAAHANAERYLTDLLQLSDLLQQASRQLDGERALIRYLHEHLQGEGELSADATRLQLESDDALVRVVTIHKSKGLEYPCVFLPFLLLSREVDAKQTPLRLHDTAGQLQFEFRPSASHVEHAERERLAEDLRKLYVALTRACYYCQIEVAPLKEQSALAYLLTPAAVVAPKQLPELCQPLLEPGVIELQTFSESAQHVASQPIALHAVRGFLTHGPTAQPRWWFASYSALAMADDHALESKRSELQLELQTVLEQPELAADSQDVASQLLKGAHIGTFLHEQLEWASTIGFATVADDPTLWWQQLPNSALNAGLLKAQQQAVRRLLFQSDLEADVVFADADTALLPLQTWLDQLLRCPLPPLQTSLAQVAQTLAELEFWLPVSRVNIRQLDQLICQHVWPDEPRPALAEGQLNGMLKGFIDLLICHEQRYFVMDFKSNFLPSYDEQALRQAVLAKRYDVQAVLYVFALYRLLKSRGVANAMSQLGPALYWFLRGASGSNAGVIEIEVPAMVLLRLDQWFVEATDVA